MDGLTAVLLVGVLLTLFAILDRLRELSAWLSQISRHCEVSADVLDCDNARQIPVLLRAIRRNTNPKR